MATTIRIYGEVPCLEVVRAELSQFFSDGVHFENGNLSDDQRSSEVWGSDLLLCGFGPSFDAWLLIGFLSRVIGSYGAWGYLPQVVVGEPEFAEQKDAFLRLGISIPLKAGASSVQIARKVTTPGEQHGGKQSANGKSRYWW